ncbi:MAG: hypothetical protein DRP66_12005 [Planctomycetota bacterium]|nr:MAG: hypothetical protein DRP66_12005 [Planctomycetota bacterium]
MFNRTILLLLISICSVLAGCATNPVTGQNQLMLISPQQELELGRQYSPEVQKQLGGPISNPQIQSYVAGVGAKIARAGHMPDLEFHYTAVNDKSINAMALPGGHIFITRGMLQNIRTEAQLAAILAHETVHVTARHSADAMSKQIGMSILLSAVTSKKTSQTLVSVAELGAQILSLKYSRTAEYEADTFGLDYMAKAGYNPSAMVELMEILESQNSARPIEFFSTHPNPASRKEKIRQHIASMTPSDELATGQADYKKNVLEKL